MRQRSTVLILMALLAGLLGAPHAFAAEPNCPVAQGGQGLRSDIVACGDFESTTACTTGFEPNCWFNGSNGGLNQNGSGWQIVNGTAAVGSRHATATFQPGTTGPGFAIKEPIQPTKFLNVNLRVYNRFRNGFISFDSGHGMNVQSFSDSFQCFAAVKLQGSTYAQAMHVDGVASCGVSTIANLATQSGTAVKPR
jgi:hypothetical protein